MSLRKSGVLAACAIATAAALVGCSLGGSSDETGQPTGEGTSDADATEPTTGGSVTLVTHDSFALSEGLLESFTEETGVDVVLTAPGDGGELVNQLILTKDSPLGDVVYGVDNTFASRAVDEGVFVQYSNIATPVDIDTFDGHLTPIDQGEVCLNVDLEWFADNDLAVPETFEELADPAYEDLTVVTNPSTSSPGLSFMLATVGHFGEDGWIDYWQDLMDNGLRIAEGWSDAYYVDFSGSEGQGPRPIALSYSTSPAAELDDDGQPRTGVISSTCFRQVEYAGIIEGTENLEGAQALIDFLLSVPVQNDIPGSMYMYPVMETAEIPSEWAEFAPLSENPVDLDPALISENRTAWLEEWLEAIG